MRATLYPELAEKLEGLGRRGQVLADSGFEVLAFVGVVPPAPIAQTKPRADHHQVVRILAIAEGLAGDVPRFVEATNTKGSQELEHPALLAGQYPALDDDLNRHGAPR